MRGVCILLSLFFIGAPQGYAAPGSDRSDSSATVVQLSRTDLEALINREGTTVQQGDIMIRRDQTLNGHLVVVGGNAYVGGTVHGDLIVINGSASLYRDAVVTGDLTIVGGHTYASRHAEIRGRRLITNGAYRLSRTKSGRLRLRPDRPAPMKLTARPGGWRYTRVRGQDFGLTLGLVSRRPAWYPRITGTVFIPTIENNHGVLDFSAAVEEPLFQENRRLRLRVEGYKNTATNDAWAVPPILNSLAGFITKNDFYNYFLKKGLTASAVQHIGRDFSFGVAYRHDNFKNIGTHDPFTFFGGDRAFRVNPDIDPGDIHSLVWTATYDTRGGNKAPDNAWQVDAELERAIDKFGSDFEFTRFDITVHRYNEWGGHHLDIRAKFAGSGSPLPLQRSYVLGAYSGLRGFDDFEYTGDRLLVVNGEYRIPVAAFRRESIISWKLELVPFFDTGTAYFSASSGRNVAGHPARRSRVSPRVDAPIPGSYSDLRSDAGLGIVISSRILYASIHVAQNLNDSNEKPRILFFVYRNLF